MPKQEWCESIATIIADYREGQIPAPDANHVERWIDQFDEGVRIPLLTELAHVLERSYIPKSHVVRFLERLASNERLAGKDPATFWRGVRFLRLQRVGNSQRDMLAFFDRVLQDAYGFTTADCGANPQSFVYLDDGVFSGGRVKSDLTRWIVEDAPRQTKVRIVVMLDHLGGSWRAGGDIAKAAEKTEKTIVLEWWRSVKVEDRRASMPKSDVLRPTEIPAEAAAYVAAMDWAPVLRTGAQVGRLGLFSSGDGRHLIEQAFLKGGVEVRRRCPNLPEQMRPLGATWLQTTGFGTMFVTYRNIANNAPLVLWAADPWYPLFPRRTN